MGRAVLGALLSSAVGSLWILGGTVIGDDPASTSTPTLEIAPTTMSLAPGDTAEARVIVRNPTGAAVTIVDIAPIPMARVHAELEGIEPNAQVGAGSSLAGTLRVTGPPGVAETELTVIATVTSAPPTEMRLTDSIAVKPVADTQLFDLEFVTAPGSLNDGDCRVAILGITNNGTSTLTSVVASPISSDDITATVVEERRQPPSTAESCGDAAESADFLVADIGGGETAWVAVELRAAGALRTGTQEVAVAVTGRADSVDAAAVEPASAQEESTQQELVATTALASHEVTLAVFGVDALSVWGLSTLFVVPGVMAIAVYLVLTRRVYPKAAKAPDTLDYKDLRLMPVVVGAGVVVYLIGGAIAGINLMYVVGTIPVLMLLAGGTLLGVAAWGLVSIVYFRRVDRTQIRVDDDPITLLKRLEARAASLTLPSFEVQGVTYVHLGAKSDAEVFAAPRINYVYAADNVQASEQAFVTAIETDDIATVITAAQGGVVALSWSNATGIRTFPNADAASASTARLFVEQVVVA